MNRSLRFFAIGVLWLCPCCSSELERRGAPSRSISRSVPRSRATSPSTDSSSRKPSISASSGSTRRAASGRPIVIDVGDSRADPKEAAALAQKFTSDNRIVAEIGDFSSTACLAAQPIYDRAGMVQLSPTASHPNFAPGSPWSFGIVGTQAGEAVHGTLRRPEAGQEAAGRALHQQRLGDREQGSLHQGGQGDGRRHRRRGIVLRDGQGLHRRAHEAAGPEARAALHPVLLQ